MCALQKHQAERELVLFVNEAFAISFPLESSGHRHRGGKAVD